MKSFFARSLFISTIAWTVCQSHYHVQVYASSNEGMTATSSSSSSDASDDDATTAQIIVEEQAIIDAVVDEEDDNDAGKECTILTEGGDCLKNEEEEINDVADDDDNDNNNNKDCPSRPHVIRCAAKYLDVNQNGALERMELEEAMKKVSWIVRGLLKVIGSVDSIMKKCEADGDGKITMEHDMEATKDTCLATCFKRKAFKKLFFADCEE